MSVSKLFAAVAVVLSLAACSQSQVAQTEAVVSAGCAVAPVMDSSASQAVQADVAKGCVAAQAVAPVVAPYVVK